MNRAKKFSYNTIFSILKQFVGVICGFILPRLFLTHFGSDVNGLVSSISQFLSYASIFDAGMGVVIEASLYKPIAESNQKSINQVVTSGQRFYYFVTGAYSVYTILLVFIFPSIVSTDYDFWFTAGLILAISISSLGQYCFGSVSSVFLNANQKSHITSIAYIITIILNTVISALLISLDCSVQMVKLVSSLTFLLRPIIVNIYVRSHYRVNWREHYDTEPIKQKWNGLAQHLAALVLQNTDVTILSILSTLKNVSIYSVYFMVIHSIEEIMNAATVGLRPLYGDLLARNEKEKLNKYFYMTEWLMHFATTFVFGMTTILIVPFIQVYTLGVTDANYNVPVFSLVLCLAYYIYCLRFPYSSICMAAGHFKQTQNSSILECVINMAITLSCVAKFGLIGVAIGTLVAMLYRTIYFVLYLKKNILNRSPYVFAKFFVIDIVAMTLMILVAYNVEIGDLSYMSWILMALRVAATCIPICVVAYVVPYLDVMKYALSWIKQKKCRK